ncbi:MAG: TetR/AcrR family transcriptional regulator [Candidatus Marinimicrobia bacterium]|nr:TetR/AcrR family transcriptional regulator [Candidatus Neomarinimicrobiota bacterium]
MEERDYMNKKQLIIEAAIKVFARDGLEKGKIADIAKEAGIGKGTVYEYFRSKDDIFKVIEESVFSDFNLVFKELNSSTLSPTEKLSTLMETGMDMFMEMGDILLIIMELWAQAGRGHVHGSDPSLFVEYYDDFRKGVESILSEGILFGEFRDMNKEGVATLLLAFMDGLVWQFVILNDKKKFKKVKSEAIESFMRGILK